MRNKTIVYYKHRQDHGDDKKFRICYWYSQRT